LARTYCSSKNMFQHRRSEKVYLYTLARINHKYRHINPFDKLETLNSCNLLSFFCKYMNRFQYQKKVKLYLCKVSVAGCICIRMYARQKSGI
jgi:hypothetical protein